MEHEKIDGAADGAETAMGPTVTALSPVEPSGPAVESAEWDAAQSRISVLESRLARAEEENRAFMLSLRHAAAAAEELLDEAHAEAALVREAAARDIVEANVELDVRRASLVVDAQRDAARMLDDARAVAHEMVVVARADANAAVHEERLRAANDLEMLAAVREHISQERQSLAHFHAELSGRLRMLVQSMLDFVDRGPELGIGDAKFAARVLTGPQLERSGDPIATTEVVVEPCFPATRFDRVVTPVDEAHLERAFDEFFSSDVEHEPSRRWILED